MSIESSFSRLESVLAENACTRRRAASLRQRAACAIDRTVVACQLGSLTHHASRWTRLARVAVGSSETMPKPGDAALRERARAVIRAGTLPTQAGDHTRGRRGNGARCALCGEVISREQTDIEIEFAYDGASPHVELLHLHVRCCSAWESERLKVEPAG